MKRKQRGKLYPPVEKDYGLGVGLDEIEWERIVDRLGRAPNEVECAIFSALWSEEFSYKSSQSLLEAIAREDKRVNEIPGSEIGVVDIGRGRSVVLRFVANNAQSHIEARLAAQTCADAAMEDLVVTGAEPLALLNLLRFGMPEQSVNHRRFISSIDGLASFSNTFGVPIIGGELYFHKRYNKGGLINGCAVAIADNEFVKGPPPAEFGSLILYAGSETGRDGISSHVAKAAIEELDIGQKNASSPTVVASDALLSSRITAALAEIFASGVRVDVTTVGAGGLATACFRMANRVQHSVRLEVNRVPVRSEDLKPKEILMSETSDRVLITVPKKEHRRIANLLDKWNVRSIMVGEVIDEDGLIFLWNHYVIADIPFHFAHTGSAQRTFNVVKFPPMLKRGAEDAEEAMRKRQRKRDDEWEIVREASEEEISIRAVDEPDSMEDTWLDLLANPNLCSRKDLYERFDQFIGSNTILGAGSDATVLRLKDEQPAGGNGGDGAAKEAAQDRSVLNLSLDAVRDDTPPMRGLALTVDANSLFVSMEPYLGTVQTVAEGMRNLAATGARPVGIAYCLNFGDPDKYRDVCDLSEAVRGLGDAARIWDIPLMSKSVSLNNMSEGGSVLPTPAVAMVGMIDDVTKACTIAFKRKGDRILLIGTTKDEIGCSEYSHYVHGRVNRLVPDIDFEVEKKVCELIVRLVDEQLLKSAHDLSAGGLAIALTESCMSRQRAIGAVLTVEQTLTEGEERQDSILFSETSGRFLVSCSKDKEERIRELCEEAKVPITATGEVGGKEIVVKGAAECSISLQSAFKIWAKRMGALLAATKLKG